MSDKAKIQSTIKMLETAIKSPATPPAFRAKLQGELDKAKKSLDDLEASEKAEKKADTPSEKKTATKRRSRAEKKAKDVTTEAKKTVKKAKEAKETKPAKSRKRRETKKKTAGTSQAKARKVARENRERQGISTSKYDIERDARRPALKAGRRVSASGNVYYENRENRIDRRPKKYARLEEGGEMAFGGRTKSALMRDRKYKSDEPHEQAYSRKRRPKNPKYQRAEDGMEMARGGSISDFKYEIYAENTKTGEKNTVAYVKAYGDIPLMITGLQKGVTSSPIKYGFKEIKKSMEDGGEMHRMADGMYKKGGTLTSKANYLSQRDIESLTTWDGVVIDGSDLMDGVYVKKRVKI